MSNPNKNKKEHQDQKKKKANPQSAQLTTPVNQRSGDRLRENPSNDEETIAQHPGKSGTDPMEQSPLPREHEAGRNQVTNEDDQKEIVNPGDGDWEKGE